MKIAVLGTDSYIGSEFLKFASKSSSVEVTCWTYEKVSSEDGNPEYFFHIDQLHKAVAGADVVVNLHEAQDFSAKANVGNLRLHNVEVVASLLRVHGSSHLHRWSLIQLSTPFLQCSSRWPNVYCAEERPDTFVNERPFEAYCKSKHDAEKLIANSEVDCLVLRPVPVYGYGDKRSILCDLITAFPNFIPVIGDDDGINQMMHIDNFVAAVWAAVEKLCPCFDNSENYSMSTDESSASLHCESSDDSAIIMERSWSSTVTRQKKNSRVLDYILLADDTEKKNIFSCYRRLLQNESRSLTRMSIPFLPLYFIYTIFVFFLRIVDKVVNLSILEKLPDPDYLYFNFHHWTFFNTNKSHALLNYTPPLSAQDAIEESEDYYRKMKSVSAYSWTNSRALTHR